MHRQACRLLRAGLLPCRRSSTAPLRTPASQSQQQHLLRCAASEVPLAADADVAGPSAAPVADAGPTFASLGVRRPPGLQAKAAAVAWWLALDPKSARDTHPRLTPPQVAAPLVQYLASQGLTRPTLIQARGAAEGPKPPRA